MAPTVVFASNGGITIYGEHRSGGGRVSVTFLWVYLEYNTTIGLISEGSRIVVQFPVTDPSYARCLTVIWAKRTRVPATNTLEQPLDSCDVPDMAAGDPNMLSNPQPGSLQKI